MHPQESVVFTHIAWFSSGSSFDPEGDGTSEGEGRGERGVTDLQLIVWTWVPAGMRNDSSSNNNHGRGNNCWLAIGRRLVRLPDPRELLRHD